MNFRKVEGLLVQESRGIWFEVMVDRSSYNGWVATEALEDLARHRAMPQDDLLELYNAFSSVVLDSAAEKIRTGNLQPDGTFLVTSDDTTATLKRYRVDPVA
ncbi:MAG: DUF1488 family protein [Xanthobacteraceae bacterium]|nr:DUF1488 family protein [Xanthobacteraceae bacterium]